MFDRTLTIDGAAVAVRPMGGDYLFADQEPAGVKVAVDCRLVAPPERWPNPLYVTYYRKLTEAYGACAILAWQQRTVVGFLPFAPIGCGQRLPSCVHYVDDDALREVQAFRPAPQEEMRERVLETHCLSVARPLRRKGLGTAMVGCLVDWARAHGWRRIQGWAFEQSDFGWLPDIAFWEKCGFRRGIARGWDEEIMDPGFEYCLEL